jgi:hypothetical protein
MGEFMHINLGQCDEAYVEVLAAGADNQTFTATFTRTTPSAQRPPDICPTPVGTKVTTWRSLALEPHAAARRSGTEKWKTERQVSNFPVPLRDDDTVLLPCTRNKNKNGRSPACWINLPFVTQRLIQRGDRPFNCNEFGPDVGGGRRSAFS